MNVNNLAIEKSVDLTLNYPSVSERYYTHYYFVPENSETKYVKPKCGYVTESNENDTFVDKIDDCANPNEATCIMMHSNKIGVVSLPPYHPVIVQKKKVTKVDFCPDGFARLANRVSGKGKKGAPFVHSFSPICKLLCEDQSVYTVVAGLKGKLIEVNERLVETPYLVNEAPNAEGYLAVILPKLDNDAFKNYLLPREEYEALYPKHYSSN